MALAPGARLGNYEILSRLGVGAMGEVYRAKDRRLGRDVAIKVLPEEVASDPERLRRFEREARSASALNHPNIVTIHEIGEANGTRYIAMECVEGRTLRALIAEGPLLAKEWLSVGTQIAEGLARAHAASIVHRDLKPANIMVTSEGLVKILDFGLAKLTPVSELLGELGTWTVELTTEGALVGTVPYMSPEQASGRAVDHRSDQFSLGLVLYEMAAGKPAFTRATAAQTLAAIIEDAPEPLWSVAPWLSGRFQAIVMRCLAKDPSQRFGSTTDLVRELKGLQESPTASWATAPARYFTLLAVLGLLAVAAALALRTGALPGWQRGGGAPLRKAPSERRTSSSNAKSIAVLPFQNLSPDPENAFFADGITEDILAQISNIKDLKVIARTSVMRYKGTQKPIREIASELGVATVLEGSVRRAGNRVRIVSQLIDAGTEEHLWAETYDRDLEDVFAIQSEVAQRIAAALEAELSPAEKARIEQRPTRSMEAYDLYLEGRELYYRYRKEDNERSIEHFRKALHLDPNFALALAGLADAYAQRAVRFGFPPT